MKGLITATIFTVLFVSNSFSQTMTNFKYSYNEEKCTFDSIAFTITATASGADPYSLHLNLFDSNGKVLPKYLDGGLGGMSSGGSRDHVFYDVAINNLEGITNSTEYSIHIFVPEFSTKTFVTNESLFYTCETVLSAKSIEHQKIELVNLGNNEFEIDATHNNDFNIKVYDLNGRLVQDYNNSNKIQLNMLNKGLYIVNISQNGQAKLTQKVVVY